MRLRVAWIRRFIVMCYRWCRRFIVGCRRLIGGHLLLVTGLLILFVKRLGRAALGCGVGRRRRRLIRMRVMRRRRSRSRSRCWRLSFIRVVAVFVIMGSGLLRGSGLRRWLWILRLVGFRRLLAIIRLILMFGRRGIGRSLLILRVRM